MIPSVMERPIAAFKPPLAPVSEETTVDALPIFTEAMSLSQRETIDVLVRGTSTRLSYPIADGRWRSRRAPYAYSDGCLYVPSSSWAALFEHGVRRRLECDVSELAGLSCWRYVTASGVASLLQPTGDTAERAEWRRGMELLEQGMLLAAPIQALTYGNFGLIRVELDRTAGALMILE